MRGRKEPLYRKVNTRTHHVWHDHGEHYRWHRNTKAEQTSDASRGTMIQGARHGLDYTPLFRFLLSKVGEDWDAVHSEAVARLDREEPIFWMVARRPDEENDYFWAGESSCFSGLRIDGNNRLARVAPDLTLGDFWPLCKCCTHTFNGVRFSNPYSEGRWGTVKRASPPPQTE